MQPKMAIKRRFKDDDESKANKRLLNGSNNQEGRTHTDDESVVRNLVAELVNTTDCELNNELIKSTTNQQSELNSIDATQTTDLDDSFKLTYDFNLLPNDALYNTPLFDSSFSENTSAGILNPMLNQTTTEHNYANVPSISSDNNLNSHESNLASSGPIRGALKHNQIESTTSSSSSSPNKKNVKFKGVTVFYFSRNQGGSTIPSQGGSTLGMEMNHCESKNFTLDAHQEEKRQVHREILLRQKRYERMNQKQQQNRLLNQSDSDEDSLENLSDISDSELDFDSWYFLQPVPVKQRRALLRESGVNKIDSSEKEECKDIRLSREFCGCECRIYCDPETCQCSISGIKCQVDRVDNDRVNFPCGCTRDSCNNLQGRIEFNPIRVRTHFVHTIMRLELAKKNDSQQFNDDLLNSSNHQKPNTSSSSSTNIEIINQNTLFTPLNHTSQIDQQYELKFTSNTSSTQANEIFPIDSQTNTNILNCNESVNLPGDTYEDLYDSGDTGSSFCSENSNSDCTNDLDGGGMIVNNNIANSSTVPQTNGLSFGNLSPFSLISTVPTTNNDLLNGSPPLNYDYHQATVTNNNFLSADQSFRYYSSSLNSVQNDPMMMNQTATTNDHQLINAHLNPYYYQDTTSLYSNLATVDCYSQIPNNNGDLSSKPMLGNHSQSQLIYSEPPVEPTAFIETHYTDLSQSKSNELFPTANSNSINFALDCDHPQSTVVNSSDDSSSSGQSLNANLDDNYLTSGESTQADEDNFGEIIKTTIGVESLTA